MKSAIVVAIVLGLLAAIVLALGHPLSTRLGLALLALSLMALEVAHWPGLKV